MTNEIVMNVTPGETRIARFENGVLSDLSVERDSDVQVAGNIYLGRITRVLPGMQAAFVDIGLERAAFLYVADVVPDLFEGLNEDDEEEEESSEEESENNSEEESSEESSQDDQKSSSDNKRGDKRRGRGNQKKNYRKRPRRSRPRRQDLPRIEDVVKEGQTIVVQIVKEPIRTKGARITSHISIPGQYLVYMPTVNHVGVSRRIGDYQERKRLRDLISGHKPSNGGFIARTSCSGVSEEKLKADMDNLTSTWQKIFEKQEKSKPPQCLYTDMDIVMRSVRDNLSRDIDRLVIDSKEDYDKIKEYVDKTMSEYSYRIELYDKETPIFDVYGVETEINRALSKKIWLKSGGYIIIDTAEALTAIDVNTGKFVGKKDFDETIKLTNLEAVEEVAYQLKLRSIGGIIVIDFIDMVRYSDRMTVYRALREALKKDRVKTTISKISDLGLIEMTRKRTRDSLTQMLSETCSHCHGTGFVKTPLTVAFEIFREIRRVHSGIESRSILIKVHSRVAKILFNEGRERLEQLEDRIGKRIVVETDDTYHIEHIEIRGREMKKIA